MFKMPAVPSASYLAEGDVITSTRSIASAGNWRRASVPLKPTKAEGFPSINILTFSFPLKLTFPSTSTSTEGTLSKTSEAEPPLTVMSFPTLYILLSKRISTVDFSAIITTSSSVFEFSDNLIVPKSIDLSTTILSILIVLKEINSKLIS